MAGSLGFRSSWFLNSIQELGAKKSDLENQISINNNMEKDYETLRKRDLNNMLDWIRSIDCSDWTRPFALTLNFWNGTDRSTAEKCITEFLNRLNRKVLGNAHKRHGKRLRVMTVLEGQGEVHSHLIIESAEYLSETEFVAICKETWSSIRSAQTYVRATNGGVVSIFDARPVYSDGWQAYISKQRTKTSADDISITNMVI